MSSSPESSQFTTCVLGEAQPEAQLAFAADLLNHPELRDEASAIDRTAQCLAAALKREPVVSLTIPQRRVVWEQGASDPAGVPGRRRPATGWFGPTVTTCGIAAAFAFGLYALPGFPDGTSLPAGSVSGIPSVAIQPASDGPISPKPMAPPRSGVAAGVPAAVPMPDVTPPEHPVPLRPSDTMAAVPPILKISPVATGNEVAKPETDHPSGRLLPGQAGPGDSLTSPRPRNP